MNAIALFFSKFTDELIAAQLSFLCLASAVALYLFVLRKKKQQTAEWVPAALVKAYLDKVDADEREIRWKLFGEHSTASFVPPVSAPLAAALGTHAAVPGVTTVVDPSMVREVEALRAQLHVADQRTMEFDRLLNSLKAEKALLEQRLAAAPQAGGAAAVPATLVKEMEEMKAKLQEYEVIEDDLANLKKYQKENEQLRTKVQQYEGGAVPSTTVGGSPAAPEAKTVISGTTQKIEAPAMTVISGGGATTAPVAPAPLAAVAPAAPAKAEGTEVNTNVLAPITPSFDDVAPALAAAAPEAAPAAPAAAPAEAAAPAAEKSSKQKEDDLLSEFEKMLAS